MEYFVNTSTGDSVVYEDMNTHLNIGWICPKCGRAVSPEFKTCPYCSTQSTNEGINPGEQIVCD